MNKKKYYSIFFIALFLSILPQCELAAQEQTEDTHAHSSSMKWKGIDIDEVICENSPYDPLPGENYDPRMNKYPFNQGKKIFLYNVGTGRFIIEGGNFGMESRLFHETFGRPLYLFSDGFILSGVKEERKDNQKYIFGCNVPGAFHSSSDWTKWGEYSFTIMMDADRAKRKVGDVYYGWKFQPVGNADPDTHTYYMYEEKNGIKYYLGAAYGECHASDWKGVGQYVLMDADRCAWTSYDQSNPESISPVGNTTKKDVNGEMITIDELYQWRLVDEDEFKRMLENEDIGLNPSVSIFITDRDFTRNSQEFSQSWKIEETGSDYTELRYGYTYGSIDNTPNKQKELNDDDAWNKPIRLKHVFNGDGMIQYDDDPNVKVKYGWKNAKYGFLTFEGVGRTYTEVEVPKAGWYLVQCYGFVQSSSNHDAYIFAKVKDSRETSPTGGEAKNNLKTVPANTFAEKNKKDKCLVVGKELTKNGENYKNAVWICVTEKEITDGLTTLQIGVGKDEATKSAAVKKNGKNYFYDTDWVCVDDFRMSYLGLRPAFFYEDEENLNYLDPQSLDYYDSETSNAKQYQGASPTGQYAGAICIERKLNADEWNTFSFPMPLTGEQIRQAFGEDAKLAEIHSVGGLSQHDNVIDFKTKTLFGNSSAEDPDLIDYAVEPGHFYLLKPTKLPLKGIDPRGREAEYYELGRKYFSVNDEPDSYKHDLLAVGTKMESKETIKLGDGRQGGTASVTYVQTSDVTNFHVNSDGIYTGTNIYAPKGSYAVSVKSDKATIFHLKRDTPIKGFRGWINLDNELDQQSSKEFSMEIYGMFFKEPSGVTTDAELPSIQILSNDEAVYDLTGRKVGTLGKNLPKGIYIVKGKKFFVN